MDIYNAVGLEMGIRVYSQSSIPIPISSFYYTHELGFLMEFFLD